MTFMFLLLINSLEDEGGRMQTSLFHYSNLALKNPQKCMNTISFFSELVPWPKLSRFSIIALELSGKLGTVYIRCSLHAMNTLRNYKDNKFASAAQ